MEISPEDFAANRLLGHLNYKLWKIGHNLWRVKFLKTKRQQPEIWGLIWRRALRDPNTNATSVENFIKFQNFFDCVITKVAQSAQCKENTNIAHEYHCIAGSQFIYNMRNIYANICTDLSAYVFKWIYTRLCYLIWFVEDILVSSRAKRSPLLQDPKGSYSSPAATTPPVQIISWILTILTWFWKQLLLPKLIVKSNSILTWYCTQSSLYHHGQFSGS